MADAITPETYAALRLYIESGTERFRAWKQAGGAFPEAGKPTTRELVTLVLQHVPADRLKLTKDELEATIAYQEKFQGRGRIDLPPELRRGDVVFRDRAALIAAVDELAPETAAKVAAAEGSGDGGLEWWAIALAAGGALYWLGRLDWRGALLAAIAGRLLLAASAYLGLTAKTAEGQTILERAYEEAKAAAEQIADLTKLAIGGVIAVAAALVALSFRSDTSSPRPQTSNPGNPGEEDIVAPHAGTLPEPGARVLVRVYEQKRAEGYDKVRAAKQAWGAVRRAGWRRLEAADGGSWWYQAGAPDSELVTRTILQLEQATGIPADEVQDVWARRANVAYLEAVIAGERSLRPEHRERLRAAAHELAAEARA